MMKCIKIVDGGVQMVYFDNVNAIGFNSVVNTFGYGTGFFAVIEDNGFGLYILSLCGDETYDERIKGIDIV